MGFEGKAYIVGLASLDRLEIQFISKEIEYNRDAVIADVQITGRNTPLYHYVAGKTELPLELSFYSKDESREDVIAACKWLESLTYSNGITPQERVRLVFGKVFRNFEIWTVGSVKVKMGIFQSNHGLLPRRATVSLLLKLDPAFNLSPEDIKWT